MQRARRFSTDPPQPLAPAKPKAKTRPVPQPPKRSHCVYCGAPARGQVCHAHSDLKGP
jgi:hypothetical protein